MSQGTSENSTPDLAQSTADCGEAFVNIAGYKFVPLCNLEQWRESIREQARRLNLKGTVLLSPEGINSFVAGTRLDIDAFVQFLRQFPEFGDVEFKQSFSDHQPYNRMLVRLKKEIIALGVDEIDPGVQTSTKISAGELRNWLAENRDIALLDVRNDYEVAVGTFEKAVTLDIDHFREFPRAVDKLPDDLKEKPIVMFCTGGIRCEKAGPFMENAGFKNIFQLDGGILKYFEEVGGENYEGDCFVFDKRVALDSNLDEAEIKQCYACQSVLTPDDIGSDLYQPPVHCPHCYQTPGRKMRSTLKARNQALRESVSPLPGSQPYDNVRPIQVSLQHDQLTLHELLKAVFPHLDEQHFDESHRNGRFKVDGKSIGRDDRVTVGQRICHHFPMTVEPDVNADIQIIFEDEWLVAVNKPAPLPVHPSGRFNRNTLRYMLGLVYTSLQLRPAHRIDADTTGLVLLSKTKRVAGMIQPQFANQEVGKSYLALVRGHTDFDETSFDNSIGQNKNSQGTRQIDEQGANAQTNCKVLERTGNGRTLLELTPLTGRTHQLRLHLASAGFPIVGDSLYGSDANGERLMLHSWKLRFFHPLEKRMVELEAEPPAELRQA